MALMRLANKSIDALHAVGSLFYIQPKNQSPMKIKN